MGDWLQSGRCRYPLGAKRVKRGEGGRVRSQIAQRSEPTLGQHLKGPIIKEPPKRGDTFGKAR